MANAQLFNPSSPMRNGRAGQGSSDASASLVPSAGLVDASALAQEQDLQLASLSMPFDNTIPRTPRTNFSFATSQDLDPDFNLSPEVGHVSFSTAHLSQSKYPPSYALEVGNTTQNPSAETRQRYASENPWDPVAITGVPPTSTGSGGGLPYHGTSSGSNKRQRIEATSDLTNRFNDDEGYYTASRYTASRQETYSTRSFPPSEMPHGHHLLEEGANPPQSYPSQLGNFPEQTHNTESYALQPADERESRIESQKVQHTFRCPARDCNFEAKTQSELNKHNLRHKKIHICNEPDCPRKGQGFATINDLERHQKSVHKIAPLHGQSRNYKCFGASCPKGAKVWPRLDNFKHHLKHMHQNEDADSLLERSKAWYEQQPQTTNQQPPVVDPTLISTNGMQPTRGPSRDYSSNMISQEDDHRHVSGSIQQQPLPEQSPRPNLPASHRFTPQQLKGQQTHNGHQNPGQSSTPMQQLSVPQSCPMNCRVPPFFQPNSLIYHIQTCHPGVLRNTVQSRQPNRRAAVPTSVPTQTMYAPLSTDSMAKPADRVTGQVSRYSHSMKALNPALDSLNIRPEELPPLSAPEAQENPDYSIFSKTDDFAQIASHPDLDVPGLPNYHYSTNRRQSADDVPDVEVEGTPLPMDEINSLLQRYSAPEIYAAIESQSQASTAAKTAPVVDTRSLTSMTDMAGTAQGGRKKYKCNKIIVSDRECGKTFRRQCDLTKHEKRHERLYGCTADKCYQKFGSKNDWKRHEYTRHQQQECWRCPEKSNKGLASNNRICPSLHATAELFEKHLRQVHEMQNVQALKTFVQKHRIGKASQEQYWCGFCKEIVIMPKTKTDGIEKSSSTDERFNHIDHHFSKEKCLIRDWLESEGLKTKGELFSENAASDEDSSNSGSPGDTLEVSEDTVPKAPPLPTSRSIPGKKRSASVAFEELPSEEQKAARLNPGKSNLWHHETMAFCHECLDGPALLEITRKCSNCDHQYCRACRYVKQRKEG